MSVCSFHHQQHGNASVAVSDVQRKSLMPASPCRPSLMLLPQVVPIVSVRVEHRQHSMSKAFYGGRASGSSPSAVRAPPTRQS